MAARGKLSWTGIGLQESKRISGQVTLGKGNRCKKVKRHQAMASGGNCICR